MGYLKAEDGGIVHLRARHLVGRSRVCNLRVDRRAVSGEHAIIWWQDNTWFVRDLGSTNGTFVAGKALDAGEQRTLGPGERVSFGEPDGGYTLDNGDKPTAHAVDVQTGTTQLAANGMLALPDADSAEVTIFEGVGGTWIGERDDETIPVFDLDYLRAGGDRWQLHLPESQASTWVAHGDGPTVDNATFRFEVSRDEEYVRLVVETGGQEIDLGDRAHHYTLLTLARVRVRDMDEGDQPSEHGWVYHDELMRMLAADATKVRVDIYRARKQLSAADVGSAAAIVERRASTKQLRFGSTNIKVVPLA